MKNNKVWYSAVRRMCQWLNCRADRTQPAASLPLRPAVLRVGSLGKHNKHSGQGILCRAMFASPRTVWISLLICVSVHVRNRRYVSCQWIFVYIHCICMGFPHEMFMPTYNSSGSVIQQYMPWDSNQLCRLSFNVSTLTVILLSVVVLHIKGNADVLSAWLLPSSEWLSTLISQQFSHFYSYICLLKLVCPRFLSLYQNGGLLLAKSTCIYDRSPKSK